MHRSGGKGLGEIAMEVLILRYEWCNRQRGCGEPPYGDDYGPGYGYGAGDDYGSGYGYGYGYGYGDGYSDGSGYGYQE